MPSGSATATVPRDGPVVDALAAPAVVSRDELALRGRDEWLLTNALGGFAMGTTRGVGERRYHAWLVAAAHPPVGRVVALSTCAEWLVIRGSQGEKRVDLSTMLFPGARGEIEHPSGTARLVTFEHDAIVCRWTYDDGPLTVTRELYLFRHRNVASVRYNVRANAPWRGGELSLEVRPLTALRDFHHVRDHAAGVWSESWDGLGQGLIARSGAGELRLTSDAPDARAVPDPQWWRDVIYPRDRERGQEHVEHLYSPGRFEIPIRLVSTGGKHESTSVELRAGFNTDPRSAPHLAESIASERRRLSVIVAGALQGASGSELDRQAVRVLACAADQFIVRRESGRAEEGELCSIIAGYPWFSDWGRDSMIALPGLLLCCGRFHEAMSVLRAFASLRRRGLIPNCFDNSGHAEYNTLDASLWFIHASLEYLRSSRDRPGFDRVLLPACNEIVDAYRAGTDFNIRVDPVDGLVSAGDESTQLTWMDARRDGVVFTPRHGKAVEINALWHHALCGLGDALRECDPQRSASLLHEAGRVRASFERVFWNPDVGCLYDLAPPAPDADAVRPNQLFAVSLEPSPLPMEKQKRVLACVERQLLTPHGVRTLAPGHPSYRASYEGGLFQRDASYHQGTAWPWLLGAYVEGVLRVEQFSERARAAARAALRPLLEEVTGLHARDRVAMPVRQVCEVYDAEEVAEFGRRRPEGCMMQAWSVAELLRAALLTMKGEA